MNNKIQITNDFLKEKLNDSNFDKYIIDGKTIDISSDYYKTSKNVYLGFEMDSSNKVIRNIDKDSNAYKLGIRNGKIEELNIEIGNLLSILKIRIEKMEEEDL
jgi:hypothetical protein